MKDMLENIRKKLAAYKPGEQGDHVLNPQLLPRPPYRSSAVLIPILKRADGCTVLFTQRAAHLHAHAGQVSFPGGGAAAADRDETATALREASEEIGLFPANVTVIGRLDRYITHTGYSIVPVVGIIDVPQEWKPDSSEVANIFEVPLDYILDPDALIRRKMTREGVARSYYSLTWEDFYIWGATAGMLRNFVNVIKDE